MYFHLGLGVYTKHYFSYLAWWFVFSLWGRFFIGGVPHGKTGWMFLWSERTRVEKQGGCIIHMVHVN